MTTTERIARLQAAYDAATKGEWEWLDPYGETPKPTRNWLRARSLHARGMSRDVLDAQDYYVEGLSKDLDFIALAHNEMAWLLEQARIVERLPKTADGVPIVPNDHVWIIVAAGKVELYLVESVEIDFDGFHIGITQVDWKTAKSVMAEDCYSAHPAAESSKEVKR